MRILGTGIDYSTGKLLVGSFDEQAFGEAVQQSLSGNADRLRTTTRATTAATTFRGEVERERWVDLGDPKAAGWTFLVNGKDPQKAKIIEALRPLAEHRGMEDPASPMTFDGEPQEQWHEWLQEHYFGLELEGKKMPQYILVAAPPEGVPFHFQALLDSAASVGRVDFDSLDDLRAYVQKVIRLETEAAPVTERKAFFFAPDAGHGDATYFSRKYMAEPVSQHVNDTCAVPTSSLFGDDAVKERFLDTARKSKPALVYTASHGLGAPKEALAVQKRVNGAICCQHEKGDPLAGWLLMAEDVPKNDPFFEGAVFFQFACFGYGTPAQSDFMHWLGKAELNSTADFVAALPKRLLAHPRGPVVFVGHVDTAWLHGFDDPDNPDLLERWSPRIAPYTKAMDIFLKCQPAGLAMADMNKRYDLGNAILTTTFDRMRRGTLTMTAELSERLANAFILRTDAQNYMIFGDPAAHMRIPSA